MYPGWVIFVKLAGMKTIKVSKRASSNLVQAMMSTDVGRMVLSQHLEDAHGVIMTPEMTWEIRGEFDVMIKTEDDRADVPLPSPS